MPIYQYKSIRRSYCTLSVNTAESTLIPYLEYRRNCLSGWPAYSLMFKGEHSCPFAHFKKWYVCGNLRNVPCRLTRLNTWSTAAGADGGVVYPCWGTYITGSGIWRFIDSPHFQFPLSAFSFCLKVNYLSFLLLSPCLLLVTITPSPQRTLTLRNYNPKYTLSSTSGFGHGILS